MYKYIAINNHIKHIFIPTSASILLNYQLVNQLNTLALVGPKL